MPPFNPKGVAANGPLAQKSLGNETDNAAAPAEAEAPKGAVQKNLAAVSAMMCIPLNLLLVFVPLGIYAGMKEWSDLCIFSFNFIAIVPLAGVLGASTEALAMHTGQMIGGLLNATFGNAVEMIVTINAIKAGLVVVVQDSLIGSILSNLLLVLGMAFLAAGLKEKESKFNVTGAAANITCLTLASIALTLPTCFSFVKNTTEEETVDLSRICAIILMFVYVMFLFFQLKTHADLFVGEEEEEEEADMALPVAIAFLFCATLCVAECSEFLVDSIEGVSKEYGLPTCFIGTILLPIVGNAAEHVTAVTAAYKGKMDLALGVAVGSSTQIALFVIPFSVIVGWTADVPMTLDFKVFCTTVFLLSNFIAASILGDGAANWFEGAMLCASYVIVAIITWFIPSGEQAAAGDERLLMLGGQLHSPMI